MLKKVILIINASKRPACCVPLRLYPNLSSTLLVFFDIWIYIHTQTLPETNTELLFDVRPNLFYEAYGRNEHLCSELPWKEYSMSSKNKFTQNVPFCLFCLQGLNPPLLKSAKAPWKYQLNQPLKWDEYWEGGYEIPVFPRRFSTSTRCVLLSLLLFLLLLLSIITAIEY